MFIDQINQLQTPARNLLTKLHDDWVNAFKIGGDNDYASAAVAEAENVPEKHELSNHVLDKMAKENRIGRYSDSASADHLIEFEENDDRLYRAQVTFCSLIYGDNFDE